MFTFLLLNCLKSDFNQSRRRNELQMARPSEHRQHGTDANISQVQGNPNASIIRNIKSKCKNINDLYKSLFFN